VPFRSRAGGSLDAYRCRGGARCGDPAGVLNIVAAGRGSAVPNPHTSIDKVSFTGSTAGGRRVASLRRAAEALHAGLGSESAAIILDDADLGRDDASSAERDHEQRTGVPRATRILAPRRARRSSTPGRSGRALTVGDRPIRPSPSAARRRAPARPRRVTWMSGRGRAS
jgi:hypothetical protein